MARKEKEGGMIVKFKTQVCTTKEQSERLLVLGLKKETADCHHWYAEGKWYTYIGEPSEYNCVPAWSLDRLIAMMPGQIYDRESLWKLNINCFPSKEIEYSKVDSETIGYSKCLKSFGGYGIGLYDSTVQCIEWLIKEYHFNKQYLNENL